MKIEQIDEFLELVGLTREEYAMVRCELQRVSKEKVSDLMVDDQVLGDNIVYTVKAVEHLDGSAYIDFGSFFAVWPGDKEIRYAKA